MAARKKPERRKTTDRPKPKSQDAGFQPSAPEIRLAYTEAGRLTYDAISEQLAESEAPEIVIGEAPAGRETLSAIAEELATSFARAPQTTLPYGDRISNAPGAKSPRVLPVSSAPARDAPEIEISGGDPGTDPVLESFEIFEMATFVVRAREIARLSSEALRRRFVQQHLLHRLPNPSMDAVDRIDVTPWTVRGTVVVRVWCRVSEPKAQMGERGGRGGACRSDEKD